MFGLFVYSANSSIETPKVLSDDGQKERMKINKVC